MNEELEIINDKKDILALAGMDMYQSELNEKLDLFKKAVGRSHWTTKDLDIYIKKRVSSYIIQNEFKVPEKGKKPAKLKTDKQLIAEIAEAMNLEIMTVKHIYGEVKSQLDLNETKDDVRGFLTAQVYAQIDEIDIEIELSETEKDRQKWFELKMKAMDQLAKFKNLEDKHSINNTTVNGTLNNQNNVDAKVVIAEQNTMIDLMNKLLPQNKD